MELLKGFQGSKNDLQTWCKFHLIFIYDIIFHATIMVVPSI